MYGFFFENYECITIDRIPEGKAPRFPKKPTIKQKGDKLVMECILEAQPLPDIIWYQGSKAIDLNERIKMSRQDAGKDSYILSLEISNPTISDGGHWRCNAINAFGESNANIALNFQGKFRLFYRLCVLSTVTDTFLTWQSIMITIYFYMHFFFFYLSLCIRLFNVFSSELCKTNQNF